MLIRIAIAGTLVAGFLAACASTSLGDRGAALANKDLEQRGSPFRWHATNFSDGSSVLSRELIGTPCTSFVDPVLKADVLGAIAKAETQSGAAAGIPTLLETRCVSAVKTPLRIEEVWVVARGRDKVPYTVSLMPQASGDTDFEIHGPWGKG